MTHLEELRAKEAHLREHLMLKLVRTGNGVQMLKEGQEFFLTNDEAATFLDFCTNPQQEGQ